MRQQLRQSFGAFSRRRHGFTLIEASLTTVIVGVGFLGMLQLLTAGTIANLRGTETTTGMNLAKNVREMSLKLPFSELMALHGQEHTPPIDSRGQPLADFENWKQTITVQPVDPDRLTLDIDDEAPEALRITARILHNGVPVCSASWYAFDGTP